MEMPILMNVRSRPDRGPFNWPGFVFAAFIALFTAMFFAVIPLGAATGQAYGSAFDPTTAVMSLQPRSDDTTQDERTIRQSDDDSSPHPTTCIGDCAVLAPSATVSRLPAHIAPHGYAALTLRPPSPDSAARFDARAPPIS
jgi:hypothetical protein